jgi:hypothetical protein
MPGQGAASVSQTEYAKLFHVGISNNPSSYFLSFFIKKSLTYTPCHHQRRKNTRKYAVYIYVQVHVHSLIQSLEPPPPPASETERTNGGERLPPRSMPSARQVGAVPGRKIPLFRSSASVHKERATPPPPLQTEKKTFQAVSASRDPNSGFVHG